jgi:hypothetical protein
VLVVQTTAAMVQLVVQAAAEEVQTQALIQLAEQVQQIKVTQAVQEEMQVNQVAVVAAVAHQQ